MSKYPYVLFVHNDDSIESFLTENKDRLECTLFFVREISELNKMFNFNYTLLVTYGPDESVFKCNDIIARRMCDRWIHYKELPDIKTFNNSVNYCFINNCALPRIHTRPRFSIFTTCYNSYEKITRAYNSVKSQTFLDYEWIILDDSPGDKHFSFLKGVFRGDNKVRLYCRDANSGNIGNVKNEAVSLCRGKYVLELDHDDEILPDVLSDAFNYFENNPEVGFVYMDFANICENGDNFNYGDFICKGYGSYYTQRLGDKWVYVYNTPNINNITLSHLVCCPNHPRIWRRETLLEAGNYSEFLSVCDDYEILLRTAAITRMAKISKLGYIQYMNNDSNNFSLIRNREINRIGPQFIQPIFYKKLGISARMQELGGYEDPVYISKHSQIWRRKNYTPQFANLVATTYSMQICIIGVDNIPETVNLAHDYIVLDTIPLKEIQNFLDQRGLTTFKCYSLPTTAELRNYFLMMYRSCDDYEIIDPYYLPYNTELSQRHIVINRTTSPNNSYLEIGVEWGYTFKNVHFLDKTGVDPDPKFDSPGLVKLTSDEFFETNRKKFDVVFIDGMHQTEYVLHDFNNAVKCLNQAGTIYIDDILPTCYQEQLKIPVNFIYENGILKYTSPWTGDVWKIVYYLFKFHRNDFLFGYYNNANYRGVGMFKILRKFSIPESEITSINEYTDFREYLEYLKQASQHLTSLRLWSPWDDYVPNTRVLVNNDFLIIQIPKTFTTLLLNNVQGRDMDCYRHEGLSYIENFINPSLPVYAVVRNPYTHVYSFFFHCLNRNEINLDETLTLKENFTAFIKQRVNDVHLRQYDYIHSNKGISVKIFKFEESNFIDFLNSTHNLSISKSILYNENKHPLYDKSKESVLNLFSDETVGLIKLHRNLEFERFGYSTSLLDI